MLLLNILWKRKMLNLDLLDGFSCYKNLICILLIEREVRTLVGASGLFWSISDTSWASSGPKIISVKFQVNWTPFGFPFLEYSKTRNQQKLALGSRLIG